MSCDAGGNIRSCYKAYCTLSCVIAVQVSIGLLESVNDNVLYNICDKMVSVRCSFALSNSTREHSLREYFS